MPTNWSFRGLRSTSNSNSSTADDNNNTNNSTNDVPLQQSIQVDELLRLFSIGQRELCLSSLFYNTQNHTKTTPSLSPFHTNHPYEILFRWLLQVLIETCTAEAKFLWNFFGGRNSTSSIKPTVNTVKDLPIWKSTLHDIDLFETSLVSPVSADGSASEKDSSSVNINTTCDIDNNDTDNINNIRENTSSSKKINSNSISIWIQKAKEKCIDMEEQIGATRVQHASSMFTAIFSNVFQIIIKNVEEHVQDSIDSIGILIIIRLINIVQKELDDTTMIVLLSFLHRLQIILWPHFKRIFNIHLQSLQTFPLNTLQYGDTYGHYIFIRYAEYTSALLRLQRNHDEEMIQACIVVLRLKVEMLMSLMAKKVSTKDIDNITNRRIQLAFFINNLANICNIFLQKQVQDSEEFKRLGELFLQHIYGYIEEEL